MKKFIVLLFLFLQMSSADAGLLGQGKTTLYASFHGDPPPSAFGLNVGAQFDLIRVSVGTGVYSNALTNVPRGIANYTFMPIAYAFYWVGNILDQMFFSGKWKVYYHKSYSDFRLPYEDVQSIFSYGAAAKIIPLRSALSPLVGVGYSRFNTNNHPFGLPDQKGFFYFPVGIDYVSGTFNLGAGYNFCSAIDNQGSGYYLNLGVLF